MLKTRLKYHNSHRPSGKYTTTGVNMISALEIPKPSILNLSLRWKIHFLSSQLPHVVLSINSETLFYLFLKF
eukprot:snap_masked-scaffold_5-processed-gene-17.20-mRNA-1 protein AED:1.00 eAED:1.00 QI:0/0/0/0/1/1/2/0/71